MTNQNINVALMGILTRQNLSFNQLTGLKVGNYPELRLKKIGFCKLPNMPKLIFWTYPEHTA
jgi:hypothetical protein